MACGCRNGRNSLALLFINSVQPIPFTHNFRVGVDMVNMKSVDGLLQAAVYIMILVLAVIPVVAAGITAANLSGTVSTIVGVFTTFLAITGLVIVAKGIGGKQ